MVLLAAAFAVVVLATSFPFAALYAQHRQLAATAAQLSALQHENSVLAEQGRQLSSSTELGRIARDEYQLVVPGQTLFDILPAAGQASSTASGPALVGDPANQPLVAPAKAQGLAPDPGLPAVSPTPNSVSPASSGGTSGGAAAGPGGQTGQASSSFWSRVTNTLEFWK